MLYIQIKLHYVRYFVNILHNTHNVTLSYTPVHESPLFTTLEIKDVESFKREAIST
jgi:hypothetical protein